MAGEILVKTVSASLTPADPGVLIITSSHTLSLAPSGPFVTSEGNEVLLESDIDASFATYTTEYTTSEYNTPGKLMYQSLKSINGLSELTNKNGEAVVLKSSSGTITCSLLAPAQDPSIPASDTTPTYDLDFSFSDAAQTVSKSD